MKNVIILSASLAAGLLWIAQGIPAQAQSGAPSSPQSEGTPSNPVVSPAQLSNPANPANATKDASPVSQRQKGKVEGIMGQILFTEANSPKVRARRLASEEGSATMELLKKGDVKDAQPRFERLLAMGPMDAMSGYVLALEGMAIIYDQQGQYDKEIEMYRTLVYEKPGQRWSTSRSNACDVRMKFALALHHQGLCDEALFNYRKGMETLRHRTIDAPINITVNDNDANTDRLLYVIHLALAAQTVDFDDAEAIANCRAAIKLHPETPIGHYYLGYILELTPESDRAEARKEVEFAARSHDNGIRLVATHWLLRRGYWSGDDEPVVQAQTVVNPSKR